MWRSVVEIDAELQSLADVTTLQTAYALSTLWENAVYSEDYRANDRWPGFLALSNDGKQIVELLKRRHDNVPEPDLHLALFGKFFHHSLLIDWRGTNVVEIRETLQRELLTERIRIPHRFGRLLYDRFNDTYFGTRTDHLMNLEVQRLLGGTPQGVYQLGTLVTGPLGIVESKEGRYIPPHLALPLWHCSDTGCNAIHAVKFVPPNIPVVKIYSLLHELLTENFGPPSEWEKALVRLHRGTGREYGRPFIDLPVLIADCILNQERTALLEMALQGPNADLLRETLSTPPRRKREAEGPAYDVAMRLSSEAQLQLLLILPDRELVNVIDDTVYCKKIRIPLGEIRRLSYSTPRHAHDTGSQLSSLGLRSTRENPIVNLTSTIWRAYQRAKLTNELEWRVRSDASMPAHDALVTFIRNRGPADAARDLILSSAGISKAVCEEFQIPLQQAISTEDVAVDRLLWKLGFNPMQFDDSIQRFRIRLREFNETILANTPIVNEDAREKIRAAGVNVFVSVEDFLDRIISYNIWLLSSDHFLEGKFRYALSHARRSVAQTLGASITSGTRTVSWNSNGENDLGTLLRYLRAAVEWIQSRPEEDRAPFRRSDSDLPYFAGDEHIRFPFRHTVLWADAEPTQLRLYGQMFATIIKLIEESELSWIRNGLDHYRDGESFPTADKMLAGVARITQALELADIHRYFPKIYWLFRRQGTRFGIVEYEFRDYAGRTVLVYGPSLISGLPRKRYEDASVLAPANLLGVPNATIVFHLQEQSAFSAYWQDYPRRRRIGDSQIAEADVTGDIAPPSDQGKTLI